MGVIGRRSNRVAKRSRLRRSTGHPAWVAVAASALSLAACSSSGHGSSATTTPASQGTSGTTTTTTILNVVQLRKNVTLKNCSAVSGGWSAKGTAVSNGNANTTYTITIFFVTVPGDTVEGSGVTKVTVPAGQTADWEVVATFRPTTPTMQCVLRGVG